MWIRLAAGLVACTTGAAWAGAGPGMSVDGLQTFLRSVVDGEARSPRHFSHELPLLRDRGGRGSVLPTLTLIAGKLGDSRCVYQLRVETWTLDGERADTRESTGGRSTLKQAPCDTLVQEVMAVAEYELGTLQRRVLHGAPRANNQARDAVVAAVRENGAPLLAADAEPVFARTLPSRVNLRASPSLSAPVRATLAPSTRVELLQTTQADWYALRDGRGYLHVRALQALPPGDGSASRPLLRARVKNTYVPVREGPSLRARVLARLKPNAEVRVVAQAQDGWHRLVDQPGYIAAAALAVPGDKGVAVAGTAAGMSRLQP